MKSKEHIIDADNLSQSQLKKKYKLTYESWLLMFERRDQGLAVISQEFYKFPNFLKIVGVRKYKEYTLDRLDNEDLEYAEGKVEWRDKTTQNNNKGNNVYLTHDNGEKFTVAQWAKKLKIKPSTLYKRKSYNWSDMEILTGKRIKQNTNTIDKSIFPYGKQNAWERKYKKAVLLNYNGNRLEYLRDRSEHELPRRTMCLVVVTLSIENKKDQLLDETTLENYYMSCKDGMRDRRYQQLKDEIDKCKKLNKSALQNRKARMMKLIESYDEIIPHVNAQLDYTAKLNEHITKRANDIPASIIKEYYEEIYPRPEYTLNLPPKTIFKTNKK